MRKVKYYILKGIKDYDGEVGSPTHERVEGGEAMFHEWAGLSERPLAIIELEDGTIRNIDSDLIEFIDSAIQPETKPDGFKMPHGDTLHAPKPILNIINQSGRDIYYGIGNESIIITAVL